MGGRGRGGGGQSSYLQKTRQVRGKTEGCRVCEGGGKGVVSLSSEDKTGKWKDRGVSVCVCVCVCVCV